MTAEADRQDEDEDGCGEKDEVPGEVSRHESAKILYDSCRLVLEGQREE